MQTIWIDKNYCDGCGACTNICPNSSLQMKADNMGFLYPEISDGCIECGLCKDVCNRKKDGEGLSEMPQAYSCWSRDEEVRFESTSGGIFCELADAIIQRGGVVCGAEYSGTGKVEHAFAKNNKELKALLQSKYVQSNIGYVFREAKRYLQEKKTLLFAGTPCQVAGLKAFLNENYENLYTVDFICKGVNSPKAFEAWKKSLSKRRGPNVTGVWFKYKIDGWRKSPYCTKVDFSDKSVRIYEGKKNKYMLGYLRYNLFMRPACGKCEFKGNKRYSDITLADFWGTKTWDDDKGTSLVLLNSEKGERIFSKIKDNIYYRNLKYEEAIMNNEFYQKSAVTNPYSEHFLNSLDTMEFNQALRLFYIWRKVTKIKRLVHE